MVSVRDHLKSRASQDEWLAELKLSERHQGLMNKAIAAVKALDEAEPMLDAGLELVEILDTLSMDGDTFVAAILYRPYQNKLIDRELVTEDFGEAIAALLNSVLDMDAIRTLHNAASSAAQVDRVRRMVLSMVNDVRAVVIKLSDAICELREVKNADEETRVLVAKDAANLYAPLANRLGIGQLKWELEDLAFRYLHPDTYKRIARLLDERRVDREEYIQDFVAGLNQALKAEGIQAQVYGRPKHIYSIWKKMQNKQLSFDELFDVRAVRIIVERLQDCYGALGVVHTQFRHIPNEFDDYVANPKPNGYQSIHTVVVGPKGKTVEIQIRTQQMHDNAELGVAAHWAYKEGGKGSKERALEDKVAWLRKILLWQEEMADAGDLVEELKNQVVEDRVYVFTPKGDVIDMPAGATPLDFAYHIHSMVGHRCIGAKISGRIVPFTYQLQTGDQVEILTGKEPNPSRDWLNPHLGFVRSGRARAKIQHWFKLQDRDKNLAAGREILERELERLGLTLHDAAPAVERFNMTNLDDLLTAIGGGDVRLNQVLNYLQGHHFKTEKSDEEAIAELIAQKSSANRKAGKSPFVVQGVGNLLTHIAGCCQPVPGDDIIGYITQGKGISVHRADCEQLVNLAKQHMERVVEIDWGADPGHGYQISIRVVAADRTGLLRDITTILANEKVSVQSMRSHIDRTSNASTVELDLEISRLELLGKVLARIGQLPDVFEAKRITQK
ncbi:GTP diphosphokinase [Gallaecimonas sp. GXIMD4217]|uniref:GTP diphosphokinase n=1 Tax=Gallaecimonas sp. GXIMD4217 TaxID=3131927 RepID=UPI00311B0629